MNFGKQLIILLLFVYINTDALSQLKTLPKRYLQKVFMDTTSISKPQFLAYPVVAFSPETSWEIGLSGLYVRYAKGDTTNRLSEISAFTFYTFQKQYGGYLEHALYSDKNTWFFLGRMKFQSFPLSYYGIGPSTPNVKLARVDAFQFQIKERVLRKVYKNIYTGLEFDFHRLGNVNFVDYEGVPIYQKPLGSEGSTNFGVGLGLLYDNRHNVLNVRDGLFAELAFIHYHKSIGSSFTFTTINTDIRYFKPIRKRNVLAMQALGQFSVGQPPFNQLALMGGEMMMRGYYTGRYRDRNLIAFQTEYRMLPFSFAKRFGATVFASAGAVSPSLTSFKSANIVFAGGAGFRFLLFPKKDVWTRIDFAITNDGPGVYLFIGEAF
jgi:hypothetical protein